jgi:thiamine biosynthesis lipoprotein
LTATALAADTRRQARYRTTALGTQVDLLVTDPSVLVAAADALGAELSRIDDVASRFRPDSEIARLHGSSGRQIRVSDELIGTVLVALRAAEASDGAVDPTVGRALEVLGYDRDFALIAGGVPGHLPTARPVPGWRTVEVDIEACTIRMPEGVVLDLGATAKALAADRAATRIHRELGTGVLVSLGGDLAVAGAPPDGFPVGLDEDCRRPAGTQDETVAVHVGGLATSGTQVRHWRLGTDEVHHLLDPATGRPVTPVWRTVTVCAASCVDANTASTAAMVKGAAAPAWLEAHALPARLVRIDGSVVTTSQWPVPAVPSGVGRNGWNR